MALLNGRFDFESFPFEFAILLTSIQFMTNTKPVKLFNLVKMSNLVMNFEEVISII